MAVAVREAPRTRAHWSQARYAAVDFDLCVLAKYVRITTAGIEWTEEGGPGVYSNS